MKRLLSFIAPVLAVCIALFAAGCPVTVEEKPQSGAPAAENAVVSKTAQIQQSVIFTLTSSHPGGAVWNVYRTPVSATVMTKVTATFSAPNLTLASAEDNIAAGTYYVTVTENGKTESTRLALTVEDVANNEVTIVAKDNAVPMAHVGALHTPEDFAFIRSKIAQNYEPWASGWAKLTANSHAQSGYTPSAQTRIVRGLGDIPENYSHAFNNAAAAYQLALRWKISEETRYADAAIGVLNAWADTCTEVTGTSDKYLAAGIYGYEFAVAAELMRDYSGWNETAFSKFKQWMLDEFYPLNQEFLEEHHNSYNDHYWANWDLCNLASMLAIGILCDRRDIYNYAIGYLQNGAGNGKWDKAINYVHEVDGNPLLAQLQESGRDQGHSGMVIGLLGVICQLTWNQGDDFFGYMDNRFLKACEYMAKYNVAMEDVPFTEYTRVWGNKANNSQTEVHTVVSPDGRGYSSEGGAAYRPIWALPYYHYAEIKKVDPAKFKYTKQALDALPAEGGGGDYSPNSGGYDALGFGTLMYSR